MPALPHSLWSQKINKNTVDLQDAFLFTSFHLVKSLSFPSLLLLLPLQRLLLLLINKCFLQLSQHNIT